MPITSRSFVRSTTILLLIGFAAVLAIVAATAWLAQKNEDYAEVVTDVRRVRSAGVDLRGLLQDAETGQRGFLLTRDEAYLAPYEQAIQQIPAQIVALRERAKDASTVEVPVDRLAGIIDAKLAELAQTIALARENRADEALAIVRTGRGKDLMDQARGVFDDVVARADTRFNEAVETQRGSVMALQTVSVLGSIVILLVAGGSTWVVLRYTRELARAQAAIAALNAGLEERVRERTVDLRRANEEIQRFAYIVTHDLRAPLVNIMGFTAELETSLGEIDGFMKTVEETPQARPAKLASAEDVPEALGFIRSSTRKMDGLINAILKLSREGRRPLKPETVALEPMLRAAASAIQHQIDEAQGMLDFDIAAPSLVTDRMALEQAFGNLLDNAVKYRERSRPLRVTVRTRPAPGNRIAIEVADNGRGIAEADHERVFELFRRSGRQDSPGEGIGLAHVRSGIRNLGGDIAVSSELGVGTSFTISLPRDLAAAIRDHAA